MTPAPVAGLDYSTKAIDIGVVDGLHLLDAWEDKLGLDVANQIAIMSLAVQRLRDQGVRTVYLEQLWFRGAGKEGQRAASNINTLSLHRVATRFETIAVALGLDVRFVHIGTWRLIVFGHGRPGDPKATALRFVADHYDYRTPNHNQADAICLGHYGAALMRGAKFLTPQGH